MLTLQELSLYLNALLQTDNFNDYGTNGLQVEGSSKITKIATAVSATLDTMEKAVDAKCEALIVHHGLFWKNDSYDITGTKKKKLELLLKHNISLFAYHLPLDAHKEIGNNWKAALDMGWTDLEPFGAFNGTLIGVKGIINGQPRDKFQQMLEEYYGQKANTALFGKDVISKAALISGGAYKSIQEAISEKMDCFITGNFDEPAWNIAREEKMNFFALGHTATERIGPKALGEHLAKKFGVKTQFLDTANPF